MSAPEFLSDGKTLWMVAPYPENTYLQMAADARGHDLPPSDMLVVFFFDLPSLKKSPLFGLGHAEDLGTQTEEEVDFEVAKLRLNRPIPTTGFRFALPKGYRVQAEPPVGDNIHSPNAE